MIPTGRRFFKMSGSGNDFVFVDCRSEPAGELADPAIVPRICARGTGVGADGVVFLEPSETAAIRLVYLNADGSRADLCGNATLCTTRLSVELGIAPASGFDIETDSGLVRARIDGDLPQIDLQPVVEVREAAELEPQVGESRIGFALVGVPHAVILCDDVSAVDVVGRGLPIRRHASFPRGANANFVSRAADGWRIRTYERGVEAETLACGSGSVASAILLSTWGEADAESPVRLQTKSGRILRVSLKRDQRCWLPSLSGEARVVYQGTLAEI